MRVQHETGSTICGTPAQAILDQKNLTGLAGGVREGPNIAKYGPLFWLLSPLIREVILQKMAPILNPVNFFFGFNLFS